jgi:hypothetical protein
MQASVADYSLTYFTAPKLQLVAWTIVGLTTAKFKALILFRHKSNFPYFYVELCNVVVYSVVFFITVESITPQFLELVYWIHHCA